MFAEWNNDKNKTSVYKSASFREDSQYSVRQLMKHDFYLVNFSHQKPN